LRYNVTLDNAREPKSFASGTAHQITFLMGIYGLVASVLPVWLVLEPRDYLSTYVKLGTITVLIVGVFVVHPNIKSLTSRHSFMAGARLSKEICPHFSS